MTKGRTERNPIEEAIREEAYRLGMNFRAVPPDTEGGQWHYKVWPKGRPEPSDDDEC